VVRWLAAELKELFAAYVEAKQKHNVLDYDDPLLYWAQMMPDAAIADDVGGRFDHVLVDEYQDTNHRESLAWLPYATRPTRPRYIVEQILEKREEGALLKQQAVLFRTSSHSGPAGGRTP
jgi:superfamily I DNA/RNA helicase